MRIAIIGVGAMGCLLAALLEPVSEPVMVGRWPEQLAAVRRHGLVLEHPDGRRTRHFVKITSEARDAAEADVALVVVKSHQTGQAAQTTASLLASDGLAITLQNGLGNFEQLNRILGHRVAQGVTSAGATMLGPGLAQYAGHGLTSLGCHPQHSERQIALLREMAALFNQVGLETRLVDDTDSLIWGKLAVNAAINPLTALLRVPNGYLVENVATREIMRTTAEEVAAVAAAQGIGLPYESAGDRAIEVATATATNRSSMLQDILRGAPTEIDAISGAVVARGRATDTPTPMNLQLYELVKALETLRLSPPDIGDVAGLQRLLKAH